MDEKLPIGLKITVANPTEDTRIDSAITDALSFDRGLFEHIRQISMTIRNATIQVETLTELPEGILTEIAKKIRNALEKRGLTVQDTKYTIRIPTTDITPAPDEIR